MPVSCIFSKISPKTASLTGNPPAKITKIQITPSFSSIFFILNYKSNGPFLCPLRKSVSSVPKKESFHKVIPKEMRIFAPQKNKTRNND